MMLAWIPFRADSPGTALAMWSKVLNPYAYGFLGMRENTYLITAAILIGVVATYGLKNKVVPLLAQRSALVVGESITFSIMILFVVVFLRPINQFIYFQF